MLTEKKEVTSIRFSFNDLTNTFFHKISSVFKPHLVERYIVHSAIYYIFIPAYVHKLMTIKYYFASNKSLIHQ